ncbi:MAG: DUF368 domain-containing protein [Planctomycetaceae bacterium]
MAQGFLMGGADVIPGVSGGTVALILGIYERLVSAISRFDRVLLTHLRNQQWNAAAQHLDLRFLASLGLGIAAGIIGLASLMHHLLEHHRQYTFATFTGLILASSLMVARAVPRWTPLNWLLMSSGTLLAFWSVGLPLLADPPDGNAYLFLCGMIGICAMILPGISGAFLLLILGKYTEVTGMLKGCLHGDFSPSTLLALGTFSLGMVVGLLGFSKLLRWLLARYSNTTMTVLCGFMIGSIRKLWPFKRDLDPLETKFRLKRFQNEWPSDFDQTVVTCLILAIAAGIFVLALDRVTRHRPSAKST